MMVVAGRWCDGFARWQWWLVFFLGGGWVFLVIFMKRKREKELAKLIF